jgi:hypothetical protein
MSDFEWTDEKVKMFCNVYSTNFQSQYLDEDIFQYQNYAGKKIDEKLEQFKKDCENIKFINESDKVNLMTMDDAISWIARHIPTAGRKWTATKNYAKFLAIQKTIAMFFPVDKNGKVMKEPFTVGAKMKHHQEPYLKKLKEAKEKVWFIHEMEIKTVQAMVDAGGDLNHLAGTKVWLTDAGLRVAGLKV